MSINNLESLIDEKAASVISYIGDVHGSRDKLRKTVTEMNKKSGGKDNYAVISDVDNITNRLKNQEKYSVFEPSQLQMHYVNQKILDTDEERDAYSTVLIVENMGGIDAYIQRMKIQIKDLDENKVKQDLGEKYTAFNQLNITKKLETITDDQKEELQLELLKNQIRARALDGAMEEYHAKDLAEEINSINKNNENKTTFLIEGGNHTKTTFFDKVKQYLNNKEDVKNVYDFKGAMKVGEGENQIKFQATGNIYGISNQSDMIAYSQEELQSLYPHMYGQHNVKENLKASEAKNASDEELNKSSEYKRITEGLSEKELDFLIMHSELGLPLGTEGKQQLYPAYDDVGIGNIVLNYLKSHENYNGQTVSIAGHIHSAKEGSKTDYNNYTIRNPSQIMYKENGKLIVEKVEVEKESEFKYDETQLNKLYKKHIEEISKKVFGQEKDQYKQAA